MYTPAMAAPRASERGRTDPRWLVVMHHLRPKPDYLRVKIGRRLKSAGAVAIKNSVYLLPATSPCRRSVAEVTREIQREGGYAVACEAHFVEGLSDASAEGLFRTACDREYAALSDEARRLADALRRKPSAGEAQRRRIAAKLALLQRRFEEVVARDFFAAPSRESAAGLLSLVEDRLQGVEVAGAQRAVPAPPKGATWVTRAGVKVDRVASAWLIRRFIDPGAQFKFVSARGYRPARGELRFDMAGAEFTHEGGRCTFEVLLERFALRNAALQPIAEIVHDLDLEDGRYARAETAGVGRMIVGLTIATPRDYARVQRGGAIFENLYESFRRQAG